MKRTILSSSASVGCTTLLMLCVQAAEASSDAATPVQSQNFLKSWSGVWERLGSFGFDPSIEPMARQPVPYNDEWMKRYDEYLAQAAQGTAPPDPLSNCLPSGMPRLMNMPYRMETLATPGQLTIVAENGSQVRRIYLDGRPHPPHAADWPSFNGHSIGHWEGSSLVVGTIGIRDDTLLDQSGIRHSDSMTLKERFRMVNHDLLEDVITVSDPKAFKRSWMVTKQYHRLARNEELLEFVCEENNRNAVVDGKTEFNTK